MEEKNENQFFFSLSDNNKNQVLESNSAITATGQKKDIFFYSTQEKNRTITSFLKLPSGESLQLPERTIRAELIYSHDKVENQVPYIFYTLDKNNDNISLRGLTDIKGKKLIPEGEYKYVFINGNEINIINKNDENLIFKNNKIITKLDSNGTTYSDDANYNKILRIVNDYNTNNSYLFNIETGWRSEKFQRFEPTGFFNNSLPNFFFIGKEDNFDLKEPRIYEYENDQLKDITPTEKIISIAMFIPNQENNSKTTHILLACIEGIFYRYDYIGNGKWETPKKIKLAMPENSGATPLVHKKENPNNIQINVQLINNKDILKNLYEVSYSFLDDKSYDIKYHPFMGVMILKQDTRPFRWSDYKQSSGVYLKNDHILIDNKDIKFLLQNSAQAYFKDTNENWNYLKYDMIKPSLEKNIRDVQYTTNFFSNWVLLEYNDGTYIFENRLENKSYLLPKELTNLKLVQILPNNKELIVLQQKDGKEYLLKLTLQE